MTIRNVNNLYAQAPTRALIESCISTRDGHSFDRGIQLTKMFAGAPIEGMDLPFYKEQNNDQAEQHIFTRSAFSQLCSKLCIPISFFDRCSRDLQRQIFNYFVGKQNKTYFFRYQSENTVEQEEIDNYQIAKNVRAVLSDSYSVMDDSKVFPMVMDVLGADNIKYSWFKRDEHISQLLIEFTDAVVVHNERTHIAGVLVSNSETGKSSVWIEPVVILPTFHFVNRESLRKQNVSMRIVHRGDVKEGRIRDMALQAKEIAQVGIIQVAEAWATKLDTTYALRFAKGIDSLPKRLYSILEEEWEGQLDIVKAAAAQRIIELAQELPLFKRIPVEQEAGQLLGLFNNYEQRMADIMAEMD